MYEFLTEEAKTQLRRERLVGLEGDHYRVSLAMEEAASPEEAAATRRDLEEIGRRIKVHRAVLWPEPATDPEPLLTAVEPTDDTSSVEAAPTDG